jgi:hypothetical protein
MHTPILLTMQYNYYTVNFRVHMNGSNVGPISQIHLSIMSIMLLLLVVGT